VPVLLPILSLTVSGVDDVLAMLLALAASPEEVEVMMISVTYGNVEVQRYSIPTTNLAASELTTGFEAVYEMWLPSSTLLRRSWSGEEPKAD
jgi:hypothetical protein